MLALGSVEYIKRKFGVGYLLNIDYYKPVPKETHSILIKLLKGRDKNVKEKISENLPV